MTAEESAAGASAPPRPTVRHRIEYVAVRAFAGVVAAIGVGPATALAKALAGLYALVDRRHFRIAQRNLETRLGLEPAAAARMAHASFRHLFVCGVEVIHLDRVIARRGLDDVIRLENLPVMEQALAAGRGVILCTAHLGNWEVIARVPGVRGWKFTTVYRPLDNPLLDRWIERFRTAHGQEMVRKEGAMRPLLRCLRNGDVAALLVDQDARSHGILAPFLGRPASTITTPAELALRTGAAIITAFTARTGPGFRHTVRFDPPLEVAPTGDRGADVLRITTEINRRLEAALRRAPEQWLWAHRRWKSSPPVERAS